MKSNEEYGEIVIQLNKERKYSHELFEDIKKLKSIIEQEVDEIQQLTLELEELQEKLESITTLRSLAPVIGALSKFSDSPTFSAKLDKIINSALDDIISIRPPKKTRPLKGR